MGAAIPDAVDWRTLGKVVDAKSEGTCGASWAFASAAAAESYSAVYGGSLVDLSEEYVLECAAQGSCVGGSVGSAMELIAAGVPTAAAYPYQASHSVSATPKTVGICVSAGKIALPKGATVASVSNITNSQFKALVADAPVVALMYATDLGFPNYDSGVYACPRAASVSDLNHAVEVVGFDAEGNYIVKNSWGKQWGQAGFAVIDKDDDKNCAINQRVYFFIGASEQLRNVSYTFRLGNLTIVVYSQRLLAAAGIVVVSMIALFS